MYGESHCKVEFVRYLYGPNCAEIVPALLFLKEQGLININEKTIGNGDKIYLHTWNGTRRPKLEPEIERIACYVIGKTKKYDLKNIKRLAYGTPSMHKILSMEQKLGCKMYGEVINMADRKEKRKKIPISRLKTAFYSINRESRGTDQEYLKIVIEESQGLKVYRERAEKCPV